MKKRPMYSDGPWRIHATTMPTSEAEIRSSRGVIVGKVSNTNDCSEVNKMLVTMSPDLIEKLDYCVGVLKRMQNNGSVMKLFTNEEKLELLENIIQSERLIEAICD